MFPSELLICLVAAIFFAVTIFNLRLALAIFVALLPIYVLRFSIPLPMEPLAALPSTLLEVLFGILFLGWLMTKLKSDQSKNKKLKKISLQTWIFGLTLLMLGATIGVSISATPLAALGLWRAYFLEPFLFFIIFIDVVRDAATRRLVLAALGSTVIAVGIIAAIQKITGWWIPNPVWVPLATRRVTAFYGYPNAIGLMAAPITMLMTAWCFNSARRIKKISDIILPIFAGLAALLGMLAIIFAVSEGAMIGLLAGLIIFSLLTKPLRPFALGAIVVACVVIIAYAPLRNYVSLKISTRDDSWSVRKIVWSESVDMLADRPIFGAGLSGYQSALAPYHQADYIEIFMYPHNIALNFWTETGLIGLIGFLTLVIVFFVVTIKLIIAHPKEWLPIALTAAMIVLLVHGLVDVPYFKNDLAMLFFVLLGLAESMRHASSSQLTTKPRRDIF
jgi:O-antigen ligase